MLSRKKPDQSKQQRRELIQLYRKALRQGVSLESLEEKIAEHQRHLHTTAQVEASHDAVREATVTRSVPKAMRIGAVVVPLFFISVGLYLVGSAVFPIALYYLTSAPQLQAAQLTAPIPREQVMDITPMVIANAQAATTAAEDSLTKPQFLTSELDYTNLSNWFDADAVTELQQGQTEESYTVDIPKLKIEAAKVTIGGTDLNKSLISYPGTALPGEKGAPVIFGHSVLRQFYNPSLKNPRRYTSIFSTLMTLEKGDKIYITHNGAKYTYVVQDKSEVKPTDVYILTQHYDSKQLKLVTCVPEGTYLRRGVITAQLVEGE